MSKARLGRSGSGGLAALIAGILATGALTVAPTASAAVPASAGKSATSASEGAPQFLSADQAASQARQLGKPVVASALTTPTEQTTANPNGTLTLTQTAAPTRIFQHGAWAALDGTLKANPDGTWSPSATGDQVVLSGGGSGPLARMYTGGQGFTLTLPVVLPHPKVSGDQAVYANVIPGVDLTVTVTANGAVSDVFTVRSASAARDPRLQQLLDAKTTTSPGLSVATDKAGDLAVTDKQGHQLFSAPAPLAWDSHRQVLPQALARTNSPVDATSSADGAGYGARTAKLAVTATSGRLDLAAPTALLGSSGAYPVFIDPPYSASYGGSKFGWASVGSGVPTNSYWNSTVQWDGTNGAEVGNSGSVQGEAMSLFNMQIDAGLKTAKIYHAYFGINENYSWACPTSGRDQAVNLYAPSQTLNSSNATWNNWVGNLGSSIGSQTFAMGYNSSCPGGGAPAYEVTSAFNTALSAGKAYQTFALRADDGSDNYAFKVFVQSSAQLTVTYDRYPDTPSGLSTSPATNCSNTTLGDTSVTLYAPSSTPTGSSLTTTVNLYKTSDKTKTNLLTTANGIPADTFKVASGQSAVLVLHESFFKGLSGGAATGYSFIAQTTDTTLTSGWSTACSFTWDPTRPGTPGVAPTPTPPAGTVTCKTLDDTSSSDQIQAYGSTCSFTLTPPTQNGGTPQAISGYIYQVDQSPPVTVSATGTTTISVPLEHLVNALTVSALSAGGNAGSPMTVWFDGTSITPPAHDGDLTLDGTPDLIVPGGSGNAFSPGLWLATGNTDGTVSRSAVNIGANGLDINSTATPADWTGSQPITGNFCGNGAQDVMAYFPTGIHAGGATIACNDGSTGPLHLGTTLDTNSTPYRVNDGRLQDNSGNDVTQIAAAGNTSGNNNGAPDLLATGADNNLYLFYSTTPNGYINNWSCGNGCYDLSAVNSPDGTSDWSSWTIATAQLASGTAMYLWNATTGDLYLWTGLQLDSATHSILTYTSDKIASGWNTGAHLLLRAADFSGSGIPDLWATDPNTGVTTAYLPASTTTASPTVTTAVTTISTASHAWNFQDIPANGAGTTVASTADTTGTLLALTGTTGANWNTGDIYSPDALLNTNPDGTPSGGTGSLSTSTNVLDLTKSFTVSVLADPTSYGGAVLSQDGTADSGMTLIPTASGWQFSLNTGSGTSWLFDTVTGGTAMPGVWSQVTASYDQPSSTMNLYVDGAFVASAQHTAPATGATGSFRVGDDWHSKARSDHYAGRITNVQAWAGAAVAPSYAQPSFVGTAEATTQDGTVYVLGRNTANGHLVATYAPSTGGWHTADMTVYAGTPAMTGGAPSAAVTSDGTLYIATGDSADGHLQVTWLPKGGTWHLTDFTDDYGAGTTNGQTSIGIDGNGIPYIFARSSFNGDMHMSVAYPSGGTWKVDDMTTDRSIQGPPTSAGGAPSTFTTGGTLYLVTGNSANGHLQVTYLPKNGTWHSVDLTTTYGAATTNGQITAAVAGDGTAYIFARDSYNGDMHAAYVSGTTWKVDDMTADGSIQGPPASAGGPPASYTTTDGTLYLVTGNSANGHPQVTYLPKNGTWHSVDFTSTYSTPVTDGNTSMTQAPNGTSYIFSRDSLTGDLQTTYTNGSTWTTTDMTTNSSILSPKTG